MNFSYWFLFTISLIIYMTGSMINILADFFIARKQKQRIICDYCGQPRLFYHYIGFYRNCPFCGANIPLRYGLLILMTISISIITLMMTSEIYIWVVMWFIWSYCLIIAIIDWEKRWVLRSTLIVGIIISLLIGAYLHGWYRAWLGGLIYFWVILLIFLGGLIYKTIRFKKLHILSSPIGLNDVILACILGLILGEDLAPQGLAVSFVIIGLFSLILFAHQIYHHKYDPQTPIPFGALLSISGLFVIMMSLLDINMICALNRCVIFPKPIFPFLIFP